MPKKREGPGGNCMGGYAEAVGTLGGCRDSVRGEAEAVETL